MSAVCHARIFGMIRTSEIPAISVLLLVLIFIPSVAFGLPAIVPCGGPSDPCTVCDLAQVAQNVLNVGIFIAIFLSSILFAWAGVLYLTSSANVTKIGSATELFQSVLVGLIIMLSAWLIIDTVMKVLVDQNRTLGTGIKIGPWNKICP